MQRGAGLAAIALMTSTDERRSLISTEESDLNTTHSQAASRSQPLTSAAAQIQQRDANIVGDVSIDTAMRPPEQGPVDHHRPYGWEKHLQPSLCAGTPLQHGSELASTETF